ncbi:Uncharacterized membrane protein [Nakamurella panacisegetis]|uniref:Uncharacterized membrane protein n=1 Tax=Nakamurella panacisegetis TaxID=1090615 RepID=A0A1H0HSL4_9ACTN|nr:MauE/DoxX family redox-associated membrane protein [Nakamurella panacisegetis]SDO22133.1 Uncharacterized membrane protein [Nakamurella panacisegetis]
MNRRPSGTTVVLIALFAGSGVLHFRRPRPFVGIVPKMLPRKEELVAISGAVELASAVLLAVPRTRRIGGLLSAALLIAVFPANVSMALRSGNRPLWFRIAAWARLPLQVPLIGWATRA